MPESTAATPRVEGRSPTTHVRAPARASCDEAHTHPQRAARGRQHAPPPCAPARPQLSGAGGDVGPGSSTGPPYPPYGPPRPLWCFGGHFPSEDGPAVTRPGQCHRHVTKNQKNRSPDAAESTVWPVTATPKRVSSVAGGPATAPRRGLTRWTLPNGSQVHSGTFNGCVPSPRACGAGGQSRPRVSHVPAPRLVRPPFPPPPAPRWHRRPLPCGKPPPCSHTASS